MSILHKILDWQTQKLINGYEPKEIALSPWDYDDLKKIFDSFPAVFDPKLSGEDERIYGMTIITTK